MKEMRKERRCWTYKYNLQGEVLLKNFVTNSLQVLDKKQSRKCIIKNINVKILIFVQ